MGIEPELTLRSLETANAIVFVLSADTGITRSELAVWNEFVKQSLSENVMVVINKIDPLWDELKTQDEIELWCRTVLVPVELELKEKGSQLKRRLLTFERIRTEDSAINDELNILMSRMQNHEQRSKTIEYFVRRLDELAENNTPDISNVIDIRSHNLAG